MGLGRAAAGPGRVAKGGRQAPELTLGPQTQAPGTGGSRPGSGVQGRGQGPACGCTEAAVCPGLWDSDAISPASA